MENSSGVKSGFCVDPRFVSLRPIGHGGNAVVYSATDSECDKEVAIKKLSFCDRRSCKYALREIRLMRRLQHENVVTVYEVLGSNGYSLEKGGGVNCNISEMSCVYIVQELLHADIHQLIQHGQLTADHVKLFTYQLLRGLKYIHSANVIHRDLKPMNLLVNVEDLLLKIADFGLARVLDDDYSHKGFLTDSVGTCWYRSPELIISPRDYTKAIDIWSVGCILAEMISGRPLFPALIQVRKLPVTCRDVRPRDVIIFHFSEKVVSHLQRGAHEMDQIGQILDTVCLSDNEWNKVTQILPHNFVCHHSRAPIKPLIDRFTNIDIDALDLLEKLLVFDANLRITAEDALAHPYLQQFSCVEDEPIVLQPFHIEHEVDELSPKSARRAISSEMSHSVESCGTKVTNHPNNQTLSEEENLSSESVLVCDENDRSSLINEDTSTRNSDSNSARKNAGNSGGVYIEDYMSSDNDDNSRNVSNDSESECFVHASEENTGSNIGQGLEQPSLRQDSSGKHVIDHIDLHLIQVPEVEERMENLKVVVDIPEEIPDEENMKEQISPKENKDVGSEKNKMMKDRVNDAHAERLVVKVDNIQEKKKIAAQKNNDILKEDKRTDLPKTNTGRDRIDFIRIEKDKMRQLSNAERLKNLRKEKKKKKNRRNNRSSSSEDGQDFDTLYRLPTEHLTRHRSSICGKDKHLKTVEEQLRLHEEINERRKMAELEKDFVGAVGGYQVELEENYLHGHRRNRAAGGNASPTSEHSRDSSPSPDENNAQRRFER